MKNLFHQCNVDYAITEEDDNHFYTNWQKIPSNVSNNLSFNSPWRFRSTVDLDGVPSAGKYNMYGGGGYVKDLLGTAKHAYQGVSQISNTHWFNKYTRAIFVEFTVYNPNVNLFSFVTMLVEFPKTNSPAHSITVSTFRLFNYVGGFAAFVLFAEIVFVVCNLYFIGSLFRRLQRQGLKDFIKGFWNFLDIVNLSLSVTVIAIFIGRQGVTVYAMNKVKKLKGGCR